MSLPQEMNVVEIAAPGGPEQLKPARRPLPKPGSDEVLVRVEASGVNRPDVMQRQGRYPPPPGVSDLPGMEVAGEIVALGDAIRNVAVGDRITALLPGGGYAEYALVAAPLCMPVPRGLDMVHAAALPETFMTVWTNLFERGRTQAGDRVLIHGGTSGIGTTAIQLANAFGAIVYATAGSDEKARACERLGAVRGINYRTEDFVQVIREHGGGAGIDVTLDMVGGTYTPRNLELAAVEGRVVTIATQGGAKTEINLVTLMQKRLTLTGSTLRPRTVAQKAAVASAVREHVWPLLEAGKVKPVIFKTFPLAQASEAHSLMESSDHIGKIVLTI